MTSLKKKLNIAKGFLDNSIKVCEFGITNCCTCKCSFCGIWKQEKKIIIDYKKACEAIDKLKKFGVCHITLTGGEPLLHPRIVDLVKYCTKKNIHCAVLNADARLLKEEKIKMLKGAGADLISISMDSHIPEVCEKSRKIPDLMDHIEKAVKLCKKYKLKTMASTVIWKGNHDKLRELVEKAKEIGFDQVSINYPEVSESKVYPLGGDGVELKKEEIIKALEDVLKLKKEGYNIINPPSSVKNIIKYIRNPNDVRFYCYGGYRVLFLDWFFNLYPCMHLSKPIGSIWDIEKKDLKKKKCNSCNMSWYRDFSIYFHGRKSIRPVYETVSHYFRFW